MSPGGVRPGSASQPSRGWVGRPACRPAKAAVTRRADPKERRLTVHRCWTSGHPERRALQSLDGAFVLCTRAQLRERGCAVVRSVVAIMDHDPLGAANVSMRPRGKLGLGRVRVLRHGRCGVGVLHPPRGRPVIRNDVHFSHWTASLDCCQSQYFRTPGGFVHCPIALVRSLTTRAYSAAGRDLPPDGGRRVAEVSCRGGWLGRGRGAAGVLGVRERWGRPSPPEAGPSRKIGGVRRLAIALHARHVPGAAARSRCQPRAPQ